METTTISTRSVLKFIERYRALEKATYQEGYNLIYRLGLNVSTYQHLCDHWKGKKKHFANFFLNLGHETQIKLIQQWGFVDPADEAYLSRKEDNPVSVLFTDPPATVKAFHKLLLFFNNHGIESFNTYTAHYSQREIPGFTLTVLPPEKKRFGNSANWGDYILSLEDPDYVIRQILTRED
jgi:hypothetical protein